MPPQYRDAGVERTFFCFFQRKAVRLMRVRKSRNLKVFKHYEDGPNDYDESLSVQKSQKD